MTDDKKIARICSRAVQICEIARGIFDKAERRVVLKFVADFEAIAARRMAAGSRRRRRSRAADPNRLPA